MIKIKRVMNSIIALGALGVYLYALQKIKRPVEIKQLTALQPYSESMSKYSVQSPQFKVVQRVASINPQTGIPEEIRFYSNGYRSSHGIGAAENLQTRV